MRLKQKEVEQRTDSWLNLTEKTFHFATNAKATFEQGDLQTKKEVLAALGSNPTIKDGKLTIPLNEWLVPIAESYPALEKEYQRLEPTQQSMSKGKNEAIASLRSTWLGGWDAGRTGKVSASWNNAGVPVPRRGNDEGCQEFRAACAKLVGRNPFQEFRDRTDCPRREEKPATAGLSQRQQRRWS